MNNHHELPLTIALRDLAEGEAQIELVGGKAANLVELLKLARDGFTVPPGFCVTSAAFQRHLRENGLTADYEQFEAAFRRAARQREQDDSRAEQELLDLCAALRTKIESAPLPATVRTAIAAEFHRLRAACGGDGFSVAVRSSGVAEDLPDASFAGQYDSFLNQRGLRQVSRAVRRCFASNFGDRVVRYKLELHAAAHRAESLPYGAMAVIV